MHGRLLGVVLAAAMTAPLCGCAAPAEPALPALGRVPEFSCVDQSGQAVTRADLLGAVWIADFIFTRCAGQCPMMSGRMAELARAIPAETRARFVSFTVDPEHDTPERLAEYARHYDVPAGRWRLLTGDAAAMTRLAREGFKLAVSTDGTPQEPITHSTRFTLIDAAGQIRGYYDAGDPGAMERLGRDARRLSRPTGG